MFVARSKVMCRDHEAKVHALALWNRGAQPQWMIVRQQRCGIHMTCLLHVGSARGSALIPASSHYTNVRDHVFRRSLRPEAREGADIHETIILSRSPAKPCVALS